MAVAEAASGNRAARGPAPPVPVAAAPSAVASPPPGARLVVPGELDAAGELLEPRERYPSHSTSSSQGPIAQWVM